MTTPSETLTERATEMLRAHQPLSWPREGVWKVFDRSGRTTETWFVPSHTLNGAYRRVQYRGGIDHYWTCTCPAGEKKGKMGHGYERVCRHVNLVGKVEDADGHPNRPQGRITEAVIEGLVG